jgi:hypothetical protein
MHWPHLNVRGIHVPQDLDWSVTIAAALVGASICTPLAMFAFAPPVVVALIGLLGASIGVSAAVLACEENPARKGT